MAPCPPAALPAHFPVSALLPLRRFFLCLLALLPLAGCERPPPQPWDQQVYIWQRQWRPAHAQALAASRADFSTLRVLAAQRHPHEGWIQARIEPAVLHEDGRPVIAVIRLDGQLPRLDSTAITQQIQALVSAWQASGINLRGVEIDHDCATSRLPAYTRLLHSVREALPTGLPLSITALPAWLGSPALEPLLAAVDSSVLQVHAVSRPERGLLDNAKALQWARAYGALSAKPFYLALPAYGVAVASNGEVESETPLIQGGSRQEVRAEPQQVAQLLVQLHEAAIPRLSGLIWFRLPLAGDRRAWPLPTLQAVLHGQTLRADVQVTVQRHGDVYELSLVNHGNMQASLPSAITSPAEGCEAGDGVQGYRLQRTAESVQFIRQQPGQLLAGQRRALGWLRCQQLDQGAFRATP